MHHFSARARRAHAAGLATVLVAVGSRSSRAQDSATAHTPTLTEIHGFVQTYYRSGDPTTTDGFRLRKADLRFSGDLSAHVRWRVGFDASKLLTLSKTEADSTDSQALTDVSVDQRTRILQDAAITWVVDKALSFDVGQQIIPMGLEGTISTSSVETVERTMFIIERSRGTGLGDVRDIGASANGLTTTGIEYHVGVFNETGESGGTTDQNPQKAVAGRVSYHIPVLAQLQIGASGAFEGGPFIQRRERGGTEVQYRDSHVTLRAETMAGRDGALHRLGWYGLGAWRPDHDLQFVARFDSWDRDRLHETGPTDALEHQLVVGASYQLDGNVAKLAFNVVHQTFPNVSSPPTGTFVLIAFQGLW
jgi:hypothetical protein